MAQAAPRTESGVVQRQIALPLAKAVEIAWKNIRLRLSRSLLVTSGIVLALAFLMSILTSDALLEGMRRWIESAPQSPQYVQWNQTRDKLEKEWAAAAQMVRQGARKAGTKGKTKFDARSVYGADLPDIQKELGPLPVTAAELRVALGNDAALVDAFKTWIRTGRALQTVKDQLGAPQRLASLMKANGVPTSPAEIANNAIQTRWLVGLALLVAFVGILNAMLMSVTERFREIGTMKCLGALDGFIVKLFLLESLFQGVVGTSLGILLGLLLSLIGAFSSYGSHAWMHFPIQQVLLFGGMCLVVGIGLTVAGAVYPAWQAARMQPIEAMRVEA